MSTSKVWSEFSATRKSDGSMLQFRIQDSTIEDKEEVLRFMAKFYIVEEPFNKAAGIYKSEAAMKEILEFYDLTYKDYHIMICYENNNSHTACPIIGISIVALEKATDEDKLSGIISKINTPEVKKLLNIVTVIKNLCDGIKTLGLDTYYSVLRVCVHPSYTGLGIAKEFFRLGRVLCKEDGIQACGAWMTAIGSQKAAENDGWKTCYEISFSELGQLCGCEFHDAPSKCKMMISFAEK